MKKIKKCSCGCETDNITGGIKSVEFIPMTKKERESFELAVREGRTYNPNILIQAPFIFNIEL